MIEHYKNLSLENLPYVNEEGISCIEEFKDIPSYEGYYQVSDLGRVKSLTRIVIANKDGGKKELKSQILSQKSRPNEYLEVNLNNKGKSNSKYVHRLVAEAFIGVLPVNLVVNHKDGIKYNNIKNNLEITTYSGNSKHSYHVLKNSNPSFRGECHPSTKLSDKDVLVIRSLYVPFENIDILYKNYSDKISISAFRKICYGATWKHLL